MRAYQVSMRSRTFIAPVSSGWGVMLLSSPDFSATQNTVGVAAVVQTSSC